MLQSGHKYITEITIFKVKSGHEYIEEMVILIIYYVLRATTPKVGKQVLQFCVLHIVSRCFTFMKFHNNTKQTRVHSKMAFLNIYYDQRVATPKKDNNSKNRLTRVTVHMFCKSS